MKSLLIKNASAVLPGGICENVSVLTEGGRISGLSLENEEFEAAAGAEVLDLKSLTLCAGFIDIHNHGAVGVDVNGADAAGLQQVSEFLAGKGVVAWVPTLVPDADENYRKAIDAVDEVMLAQDEQRAASSSPSARVLGVHYEGVFANEKMCGALRPQFFKTFKNGGEIASLPKLKNKNAVHLTTLAPEIENGIELIKELKKQNWTISIGHTRADFDTLNRAFEAGARQVTHLFNAMTGVHHRDIGVAGWALSNDAVSCEIIADGVHVAPEMLKFALRSKTADKLVLVSDSVLPAGLGDGSFEIWGEKISVVGGKTRNERGSIAGSVITMLDAFKMYRSFGVGDAEISKMASLNPARLISAENVYGSIEIGKRADLTAIDDEGNVKMTLIGGEKAFETID